MPNCENLEYTTTCNDEGQLEFEASNTSEEEGAVIILDLPVGTKIFDQHGNLAITIEAGHVKKSDIRMPGKSA